MRPDLSQLLDEALERLKAGATIEECLQAAPDHAAELEPLLRTAAAIQRQAVATLPPSLEQWLIAGRREIEAVARETYRRPETVSGRLGRQLSSFFARILQRGGPRMVSAALSAVIICAMALYTVDSAAARSLPGNYLYGWKIFAEEARLNLTSDPDQRAQLVTANVERRVAEIAALTEQGQETSPELIAETVKRLESQVGQALGALPGTSQTVRDRTAARIGRLLVRAQSDLRDASAPGQGGAEAMESAAAEVGVMIDDLPGAAPTDTAAIVPLPDATPAGSVAAGGATAGNTQPSGTSAEGQPAGAAVNTPIPTPNAGQPTLEQGGAQNGSAPDDLGAGSPSAPSQTASALPTRTPRPTRTPAPTRTPVPTLAPIVTQTPSANSQAPGSTEQVVASATPAPTSTAPATATLSPTSTPSATPTDTVTPSATHTLAPTATATPTNTATATPTNTATPTTTVEPAPTGTATPTRTPSPTASPDPLDELPLGNLYPILECVTQINENVYIAHFGFENRRTAPLEIPVGEGNAFSPGREDRGQPEVFPVGRTNTYPSAAFRVRFDGDPLTWTLGVHVVTASRTAPECPALSQ